MSDDKKQKGSWRLLLVAVALGSVIFVGYKNKDREWAEWTGFGETTVTTTKKLETDKKGNIIKKTPINEQIRSRKTFWDLLELSSRLAVPILLAVFGYQVQKRDKEREKDEQTRRETEQKEEQNRREKEQEAQAQLEREIAQNNLAEEAIQAYLDNMAKLLLDKELRSELFSNDQSNSSDNDNKDNPVINVARTQTITILRRLEGDTDRQNRIINFLRDAKLYDFILKNASLSGINLSQADLRKANLQQANLQQANLEKAVLITANLQKVDLRKANLEKAVLIMANLEKAVLIMANLEKADLRKEKQIFNKQIFNKQT